MMTNPHTCLLTQRARSIIQYLLPFYNTLLVLIFLLFFYVSKVMKFILETEKHTRENRIVSSIIGLGSYNIYPDIEASIFV